MSEYYNVTTNAGDAAIATAIANNSKLNITHVAFGDGNGSVPTPNKTRSTLVHEVHRQAVTKYTKHPSIANYIVIETIIPSNVGGFWIREMGIIADNVLISHGSHAPFFKVADPDGVSEYRLKFTQDVRDGSVVEIVLDESLIYASQEWVNKNYIRRNELVDNLITDDSAKPVSAKQAKKLQDEKFDKSGGSVNGSVQLTADNTVLTVGNNFDIGFVKKEGASGKLIVGKDNNFSVVRSSNSAISKNASDEFTEILSVDQNNNMSVKNALDVSSTIHAGGVVNYTPTAQGAHISWNRNGGQGRTDFINHKGGGAGGFDFYNGNENGYTLIATIDALGNFSSNAASATKLKNSRKIFGQDFDGSNDVSGNITTSTGILAADSYHYIDMGRETVDRMNFATYFGVFNFVDSKTGDIVARITKNGIDCNANSASKLQTSRKIGGVDFDGTRDIVPKSIENTGRFPAPAQKDIPFNTGLFSVSQIYDNGYPVQYGNVLNIGGAGVSQIAVGWTGGIFHRGASDISNQWSNWREIAYIDSNVASATKLKNSRNLWGNNFDGTADTNGTLNFGDAGARKILIKAETVTDGGYIAVGNQGQYIIPR